MEIGRLKATNSYLMRQAMDNCGNQGYYGGRMNEFMDGDGYAQ